MEEKVRNFLNRITHNGKYEQVIDTFSNGCCYYAAIMLYERFCAELTYLMYDPIANHFGCRICNRVYDITGDVTDKYNWKVWDRFKKEDDLWTSRIVRDCIDF